MDTRKTLPLAFDGLFAEAEKSPVLLTFRGLSCQPGKDSSFEPVFELKHPQTQECICQLQTRKGVLDHLAKRAKKE
jgi:hypothetical protein